MSSMNHLLAWLSQLVELKRRAWQDAIDEGLEVEFHETYGLTDEEAEEVGWKGFACGVRIVGDHWFAGNTPQVGGF